MRKLIVVDTPGCEVRFSGLVQQHPEDDWTVVTIKSELSGCPYDSNLSSSAHTLGIGQASSLRCPPLADDLLPVAFVAERLKGLGAFDAVYTHSFTAGRWGECIAAVAAAIAFGNIWVASDAGFPDEVVVLTAEQYQRKLSTANSAYATLLRDREISVGDLSPVETYRKVPAALVLRYFAEMARMPVYDPDDPWDNAIPPHERIRSFMTVPQVSVSDPWFLASSKYEEERYQLELSVLDRFPWRTLVEVGACVGAFTLRLLDRYPDRTITACEPYEPFARELEASVKGRAQVLSIGANQAVPESDVLFASSCLYYIRPAPMTLLNGRAAHWVLSHCHRYQKRILEPCMKAMGHELVSEDELPARVEESYGVLDVKDGTVVQVWRNGLRSR